VRKKLIKNSQPFGKKIQKTAGGGIFLTHTVEFDEWYTKASRGQGHGGLKVAKMADFKVYLCRYARNQKTNGELW